MLAYMCVFKGSYLGGKAIVLANTPHEAETILKAKLIIEGYPNDNIEVMLETDVDKPGVIFYDEGDY